MLKNVVLKRFLKNMIFPVFSGVNRIIRKRDDIILLYSANGGINNSLLPLRDLILSKGLQNRYRIYCGVENLKFADDVKDVTFISQLKSILLYFRAGHVFYTTGQIPIKPSRRQRVIQLGHGATDYKTWGKWSKIGNGDEVYFTHIAVSSDLYVPIYAAEVDCDQSMVVPIGDVLADQLFVYPRERRWFKEFDKVLVWYPTFRKSDYLGYDDSTVEGLVPMFDESDYPAINEYLKKYNIKLIVKTHPMQDNVGEGERHFSHLDIYTHSEFVKDGLNTYELLAQSDGLIGDYSSISLHSLFIDIPLAYVIPDIEDYGRIRGFIFKHPEEYMPGSIIKDKNAFYKFIDEFAAGIDNHIEDRHRVRDIIFKYQDGKTCERALEICGVKL